MLKPTTYSPRASEIDRSWWVIDASDQILGRLASEVSSILRGKHKPMMVPHLDTGDHVIVINAALITVTGNKLLAKTYYRHSGYPGGIRKYRLADRMKTNPEQVVKDAVWGMMPKGPLGRQMIRKLRVYADDGHPHKAQEPQVWRLGRLARGDEGSEILGSPLSLCEGMRDVGLRMQRWIPEIEDMTILPITDGGYQGSRLESSGSGLLNVFSDDVALTASWSTRLSALDCLQATHRLGLLKAGGKRGAHRAAEGVLSEGNWEVTKREDVDPNGLMAMTRRMVRAIPKGQVDALRLETEATAWVWLAASPLQSGQDVSTFGVTTHDLRPLELLRLFDETADSEANTFRDSLRGALGIEKD